MGNRHDVYIWDADVYGKPQNFEDAMDMAKILAKKPLQTQTANMLAFGLTVETLLKNYDEDEQHELFLKGTAADIANTHKAAYNMEISEIGLWPLLLKILFDAAKEHSVVIFDQEAWIACISPNTILPESAELEWQRTVEKFTTDIFPKTPKQMKKYFEPLLTNLLVPYGFRQVKDPDGLIQFKRDYTFLSQLLRFGVDWCNDNLEVIVLFTGVSDNIAIMKQKLNINSDDLDRNRTVFYFDFFGPFTHKLKKEIGHSLDIITSEFDVIRVLNLIKNLALPLLNDIKDLKSTHIALNTDKFPDFRRCAILQAHYQKTALAIARLANPNNIEEFERVVSDFIKSNLEVTQANDWAWFVDSLRKLDVEDFFAEQKRLKEEAELKEQQYQYAIKEHLKKKTPSELMELGEWYDTDTNLIWQRYCLGQEWQNGSISGHGSQITWAKAVELTSVREVKDFTWRLPTEKELASLMLPDKAGYKAEQGVLFCPKEEGQYATFWTSTTDKNSEEASVVVFYEGKSRKYPKGYGCFVRLVRNGKGKIVQ